ncbi:MAG: hypothetical protein KBE65_23740 [Phycisphaerae bacterium]|nr:hypothetical protein [Phycisphaerae bacterium]
MVGLFLSVVLLSSCATRPDSLVVRSDSALPAVAILNKDAGCGNGAIVTLRMEDGRELPFFVDTGAPMTVLDKSLEPELGKCLGTHTLNNFGVEYEGNSHTAPRLYLGVMPLATDSNIVTSDFLQKVSSDAGRSILGVLGMDCLQHYCVQFDFRAREMRFLDPNRIEPERLGKAFPLTLSNRDNSDTRWVRPYIHHSHLVGAEEIDLLIDTGHGDDGALEPEILRREIQARTLRVETDVNDANEPKAAYLAGCIWSGESYKDLVIGNGRNTTASDDGENSLGLRFLARHLVTFDFPHRTLYLKRIRSGPLVDKEWLAATKAAGRSAFKLARKMIRSGQLPGWSKNDPMMSKAICRLRRNPDRVTLDACKKGDPSSRHYEFIRLSKDDPWRLHRAWRTDPNGRTVEVYPVP